MSEEVKNFSYADLPENIRRFISSEQGRKAMKYFAENPEAINAATRSVELYQKAKMFTANNPEIQKAIHKITEKVLANRSQAHSLLQQQIQAAQNVALSGCMGEFYKNRQVFFNLTADNADIVTNTPTVDEKINDDLAVPEDEKEKWEAVVSYLESLLDRSDKINENIDRFLRKFKIIALKNERSSATNACWSKWLAIIAIFISLWAICTDKSDDLIEVIKKSHPWNEQQISADDAKNVSVAFHAITQALQKNVQLEKDNIQLRQETARLEANLKKAQDNLSGLEKKYNVDINSDEPNKLQCLRKKLYDIEALITVILDKTPKNLNATKNTGEK